MTTPTTSLPPATELSTEHSSTTQNTTGNTIQNAVHTTGNTTGNRAARPTTLGDRLFDRAAELGRTVSTQGLTMVGQLVSGAGNLVVSVVLARLLLPSSYALFVAFLAGYVLLHTVAASVTAAVALDASLHRRLVRRAGVVGLLAGAGLALGAPALAPVAGLPVTVVLLLAAAVPSATMLAFARGRLYAQQNVRGTVGALCAEPVVRLLLAVGLVPLIGTVGAVAAVVAAGYATLLVAAVAARQHTARSGDLLERPPVGRPGSVAVTLTFLLIAVVAAQDVIFANRTLPGPQAGLLAAVATIGGAAYFAIATVPMMLLPQRRTPRGQVGAARPLLVALGVAGSVSLAGLVVVALIPDRWFGLALGDGYTQVGRYVVGYVAAMAALGIAKVLLAELCRSGRARICVGLVAAAVACQLVLLVRADSAGAIVVATASAAGLLLVGSATALVGTWRRGAGLPDSQAVTVLLPDPAPDLAPVVPVVGPVGTERATLLVRLRTRLAARLADLWPLLVITALAVALRVVVTRSIWVDEAISIQQAQLPYGEMITTLRRDDVHPPLFGTLLWLLVHLTGSTQEWVVRLPSLVAGTAAVIVLYAAARDLWDRRTATMVGLLSAIAPVAVWYAQEARMYALWMLGASIAAWMQLRILRADTTAGEAVGEDAGDEAGAGEVRTRSGRAWVAFTVATVALGYLQWFTVLPLLVMHAIFGLAAWRRRSSGLARSWVLCLGATAAGFVPLLPYLLVQISSVLAATGSAGAPAQTGAAASAATGSVPDIYAVVANLVWAVWGYHADATMVQLSALWPVAVLVCFGALGRARSRHTATLLAIAIVPALILFAVGFERRQFFELRYFTSTVPMLLLLLGRLAATWGRGPLTRLLLPVLLVSSLGWGLVDQQVNKSNPRTYDFRGAVEWVQQRGAPGDVLIYAPSFLRHELSYYSPGMPTVPAGLSPAALDRRVPVPSDGRDVFVFGSFLEEPAVASQTGKALADLRNAGAVQVARYEVANVTVWEFHESATTDSTATNPSKEKR